MSAPVISFGDFAPKRAEYSLLLADLPGHNVETIGVLLLDPATDTLHVRLRRDWSTVASAEDAEVLADLEEDLLSQARERGGAAVLDFLLNVASQSLRVSDREAVTVRNFDKTLSELYREHVSSRVLRYQTHLPQFSLAVAAGSFLTNPIDTEEKGWIEMPADLRLDEHMFVAEIRGHSMEPRIPDGSLCVFRQGVVGSRNGRLVLVRNPGSIGDDQYTVKRYKSEKIVTEEGFRQTRIRLESLNPDYPSWDLDTEEEKYQVIAEFVRVLE
jgi:SOS-response transcriptional repressor LexA